MAISFNAEALKKHKPLSDAVKGTLEVNGTTIKEKEDHKAYFENLPNDWDKEKVEELSKYNHSFVAATHVAFGELASEIFEENKEAMRVDCKVGFFGARDSIATTVHREKVYSNNFAETEAEKKLTKHLVMNTTVETSTYGLKSIRESMSEEFRDRFAK